MKIQSLILRCNYICRYAKWDKKVYKADRWKGCVLCQQHSIINLYNDMRSGTCNHIQVRAVTLKSAWVLLDHQSVATVDVCRAKIVYSWKMACTLVFSFFSFISKVIYLWLENAWLRWLGHEWGMNDIITHKLRYIIFSLKKVLAIWMFKWPRSNYMEARVMNRDP